MSSTSPDDLQDAATPSDRVANSRDKNSASDAPTAAQRDGMEDSDSSLSEGELADLQAEKLKAIRDAVRAGVYDSDELLAKAMNRLRAEIENESV